MINRRGFLLFLISLVIFFRFYFFHNLLPIPSDDLIGLYYPFRDFYATSYPRGFPFKNFLITDPIRQQFPWRKLAIDAEKKGELPLWNPYVMSGTPLIANVQSAAFYPLNMLFFLLPFSQAWGIYIFLSPFLAGIFFYLYTRYLQISQMACAIGSLVFSLCGFMVSWMEWGTIPHTLLWLPFLLLTIEKILQSKTAGKIRIWSVAFVIGIVSMFLAGHLQMFLYTFLVISFYILARWWHARMSIKIIALFFMLYAIGIAFISFAFIPTIQFILLSGRGVDQNWLQEGWFIPWQHMIQFVAPDFFGNPATMNYWGVWNYGEFVGYIGVIPFLFACFAVVSRKDYKTLFFTGLLFGCVLFAYPTLIAKLPFIFNIPFISTSQPTRLLGIIDFSLAMLMVLGLDHYKNDRRGIGYIIMGSGILFLSLWAVVFFIPLIHPEVATRAAVAKHNLFIPTLFLLLFIFLDRMYFYKKLQYSLLLLCIFFLVALDLLRFADKFTPFTPLQFLYPSTATTTFLSSHIGIARVMEDDKRILPPNVSSMYKIQSIDGYDPLYILRYGEFIAAMERNKPDISPPFGFNRIITPENYHSRLIDLMGVKYILSLNPLTDKKLQYVFHERYTNVYENKKAYPRIFFVTSVRSYRKKQSEIQAMFDNSIDLQTTGIVEFADQLTKKNYTKGLIKNLSYGENRIQFDAYTPGPGYIIMTDAYYPSWHATIDAVPSPVYLTDYAFRGLSIPTGTHHIVFYDTLF